MKSLIALVVFVFSGSVFAQTIVISDIDDTLKETHVSHNSGAGSVFSDAAFWGMPELLRATVVPPMKIFYVSNAPKEIMESAHRRFLTNNKFPAGEMRLPKYSERQGFKRKQILDILTREKPMDVIFLGDNGESDADVYDGIARDVNGIRFHTFIHIVSSNRTFGLAPRAGQTPYATAGEVAIELALKGLLPESDARALMDLSFLRSGKGWEDREPKYPGVSLGFPDWMDCRDHQPSIPRLIGLESEADRLEAKIKLRCAYVINASK